jgi:hypothetical protein
MPAGAPQLEAIMGDNSSTMADVRIIFPVLLHRRRSVDGRGRLQCEPFCSCRLFPTQVTFVSETFPNYSLYCQWLSKRWPGLPGSEVESCLLYRSRDILRLLLTVLPAAFMIHIPNSASPVPNALSWYIGCSFYLSFRNEPTTFPGRLLKQSDALSQDKQRCTVPLLSYKPPGPGRAHGNLLRPQICLHVPILRGSSPTNNLHRVPFYLIFSLLMLTILHGASVLTVQLLIILSANYALAKATGGKGHGMPSQSRSSSMVARRLLYAFATLHRGFAFLVCCAHYRAFSLPY